MLVCLTVLRCLLCPPSFIDSSIYENTGKLRGHIGALEGIELRFQSAKSSDR